MSTDNIRVGEEGTGVPDLDPSLKPDSELHDFELVLGRKQIAAVLLIALGVLAVTSSAAYVVGKAAGRSVLAATPLPSARPQEVLPPIPASKETVVMDPAPKDIRLTQAATAPTMIARKEELVPERAVKIPPATIAASKRIETSKPVGTKQPMLIEPGAGQIYLQVAAVEKKIAMDYAEKLRGQFMDAVVAPAPGGQRFRVLIGPFADQAALRHGKDQADKAGLNTILRRY